MTSRRKGSAEAMASIPHTRLPDEESIKDYYTLGEKLGQGSFGKVHLANHIKTGEKRAIKSINKEKAGSSALKLLEREVAILKRVNHPNIIQLYEVLETPKRMFLVMEVCEGGELADALKEKNFTETQAKSIMTKLASAISYLHKNDIVHRDLKLENILLMKPVDSSDEEFDIRVTDFGLSVTKGGVTPDNMMQDFCGTPMYMAPEIIDNKTYSQQCDVWAMGVIMYLLLSGCPPFKSKDEESLYELIRQGTLEFAEEIWSSISEEAKRCLSQMIKVDPAYRLSAAEVLEEPWISGKPRDHSRPANVLDMMKQWGPEMRKPISNATLNGTEDEDGGAGSKEEEEQQQQEENGPAESQEKPGSKPAAKVDLVDSSGRLGNSAKKVQSPPSSATRQPNLSSSRGVRLAASSTSTPRSGAHTPKAGSRSPNVPSSSSLAHKTSSTTCKGSSTNHKTPSYTSLPSNSSSKTKKK